MRIVPGRCARSPSICGAAAFILTVIVLLGHYSVKYGLNVPPSTSGDELSYDSIGWNLAHGFGFAEGGYDQDFRRPYEQVGDWGPHLVGRTANPELVAHRPPLFPLCLAGLNTVGGRQFWAVRTLNVLATAGTCGLLVWYLVLTQGRAAALIGFFMFLVVDTRTRLYGRAILTEATATFLTTLATLLLIQLYGRYRISTVLMLGIVGGLLVLDRTVFALWLPGMAVIVFALTARVVISSAKQRPGRRWRHAFFAAGLFISVTILVVMPWAIRNVRVLGTMMPLGTQGMSQLPAGFSDLAVQRNGLWSNEPTVRLHRSLDHESLTTRLERDVARARLAKEEAFQWIQDNPGQSVWLAVFKVWQEYRPRAAPEWLIGLSALVGALLSLRHSDTRIFLAVHTVSCVVIGCTWSVEGRFVVPLMFSTHVLAARTLSCPFVGRSDASGVAHS